jgi:hypothetical protein
MQSKWLSAWMLSNRHDYIPSLQDTNLRTSQMLRYLSHLSINKGPPSFSSVSFSEAAKPSEAKPALRGTCKSQINPEAKGQMQSGST